MIQFKQYDLQDGKLSYIETDGKSKIEVFEAGAGITQDDATKLLANAIVKNNLEYEKNKKEEKFQKYWFPIIMFILGILSSNIKDIINFIISLF